MEKAAVNACALVDGGAASVFFLVFAYYASFLFSEGLLFLFSACIFRVIVKGGVIGKIELLFACLRAVLYSTVLTRTSLTKTPPCSMFGGAGLTPRNDGKEPKKKIWCCKV